LRLQQPQPHIPQRLTVLALRLLPPAQKSTSAHCRKRAVLLLPERSATLCPPPAAPPLAVPHSSPPLTAKPIGPPGSWARAGIPSANLTARSRGRPESPRKYRAVRSAGKARKRHLRARQRLLFGPAHCRPETALGHHQIGLRHTATIGWLAPSAFVVRQGRRFVALDDRGIPWSNRGDPLGLPCSA